MEVLNAESDNQQILMIGIKSHKEVILAYWFVGDGNMEDEEEDYKLALKAFEKMKKYKTIKIGGVYNVESYYK